MKFDRLFTVANKPVVDQIVWKTVPTTDPRTKQTYSVEVPIQFSQTPTNIIASKYFRKAGVPPRTERRVANFKVGNEPKWLWPQVPVTNATFGPETSAKQVFHRMAGHWTYWGWKSGYFNDEVSAQAFYDELYYMLAMQMAAPNSPQWFNTGLWWAYGIEGPASGQWAIDHSTNEAYECEGCYERPQVHACYIQPIKDDLVNPGGIMDLAVREARLFKQGSGTGTNFSTLRGKGEPLGGGGVSSGLMSFLRIGDRAAGAIQSGGITRRAAKMVCLDADHPEIEDFINWKVREEAKALSMYVGSELINRLLGEGTQLDNIIPPAYHERIAAGFPTEVFGIDWEGEAYDTVSGQNSNNSVRLTDDFMDLTNYPDAIWDLKARTTGKTTKVVSALGLWNEICRATWASGDPGLLFHDTINKWNTCKEDDIINSCNPCGEYQWFDNTACNLASLNLVAFLTTSNIDPTDKHFEIKKFSHATRLWTVVLDISVEMASFPSKEIAERSEAYRTLGLGYANLGGLLMQLGLAYDSDKGRSLAAAITALMHGIAYKTSGELAEELKPFPRYDANCLSMNNVIAQHSKEVSKLKADIRSFEFHILAETYTVWGDVCNYATKKGFRNAQVTLLAPTGTIGLEMDCDTMGIEPDFALVKYKNLAGSSGSEPIKLVNESVNSALTMLGYKTHIRNLIMAYVATHGTTEGCINVKEEDQAVFDCANAPTGFTRCLSPMAHVLMVAVVQPFLSGAVSKTVNLPNSATIEDVSQIYKAAHRLGLKAIAPYRDGSKLSQPLNTAKAKPVEREPTESKRKEYTIHIDFEQFLNKSEEFSRGEREYMPWMRTGGFTQKAKIGDFGLFLTANPYPDGRLGEFFLEFAGQGSTMRAMGNLVSILGSLALQYGAPAEKIVEALTHLRFEPAGVVEGDSNIKLASSIADYVGRKLGSHFLGMTELTQVQPTTVAMTEIVDKIVAIDKRAVAIASGYSGDICSNCGGIQMTRSGSCLVCNECGTTTGCG